MINTFEKGVKILANDTLKCKKCKLALIDYKEHGLLCINCDWKVVLVIAKVLTEKQEEKARELERNLYKSNKVCRKNNRY